MYAMLVIKAGPQYAKSARYPLPMPRPCALCGLNCSGESSFLSSGALMVPDGVRLQYKLGDSNFLRLIEHSALQGQEQSPIPVAESGLALPLYCLELRPIVMVAVEEQFLVDPLQVRHTSDVSP